MTPDRWQQVKAVLHSVLDLEPGKRAAFLDEACTGDVALRREVEALLASHDRSGGFFETPVMEFAAKAFEDERVPSLAGQSVGPYTVVSLLGVGGMGEVYLAHDARLGRQVALKLLPVALTADAERLHRFQQEASTASRLNHPNILTIYEVGSFNAAHYIATEYIDGLTLRALMAQKSLSLGEAIDAALQIALGLAAAHAAGIVHRDIKPENVMLRRDGYLKILDFGIAKLIENSAGTQFMTSPGTVIGTTSYMSPEQARGEQVDARTDLWSLGVVLYEMVGGHLPFTGNSTAEVLVSLLQREPPPLLHQGQSISAELARVVSKALAKAPADRYLDAGDLIRDLRSLQKNLPAVTAEDELRYSAPTAPHRAAVPHNNLSTAQRTIVGRDAELAAVAQLLSDADVRLLTLTGAGGTGKTRLGQQAALDLLTKFSDGVFIVSLAPVKDDALVASAIAQTLGVKETSARSFVDGLHAYLVDKSMLLVLDNFEHVTAAAPLISGLLAACPRLKVLVTSRAALHVSGEREFRVPPLSVPAAGEVQTAEELRQSAAAVFFVQRLMAVTPRFAVTDANAATIADICIRLDGLPLALELAAARTKLLSLEELASRMSQRLTLLKGGPRDLPVRQQTMRAAIAWSYDLLDADAKALFHRQSIFAGGATLSAIEAVCAGSAAASLLDALESLVDQSLVIKKEMPDGTYRFLMLESIREYALEHVESSGEAAALARRHAEFCLRLAEDAEPHLMSAAREPWLKRLEAEHNNLRAALRWTAQSGEIETGLRLAGALRWFWYHRGHFGEGYHWATQLLALPAAAAPTRARAKALYCAGSLAFYYSNPIAACPLLDESVAIWRELGDPLQLARTLTFASLPTSLSRRAFADALAQADESVALLRASDDRWGLALALTYAGIITWTDLDAQAGATALFTESAELFRALGDEWGASSSVLYLGAIQQENGHTAAAKKLYEDFVAIMRQSGDPWRLASGLDILAESVRAEGDHARADTLIEESRLLERKLGQSLNLRQTWDRMKRRHGATPKVEG